MSNLYHNKGPKQDIQKFHKKDGNDDKGFESHARSKDIKNQKHKTQSHFCKPLGNKPNISSPKNDYAENQKEMNCEIENLKFNLKEKYKYMEVPFHKDCKIFDGSKVFGPNIEDNLDNLIYPPFDDDLFKAEQNLLIVKRENEHNEFIEKKEKDFNFDNRSIKYEQIKNDNSNLFQADQNLLLEKKEKEFKDYIEEIDNNFNLDNKRIKPSRKKKNNSKIGRRNKKIKLRVKSAPKFPKVKKDNYIKESSNDDPEGKPNAHKKTNSEKKEGKNGGKKPGGERNSKNSTKIKEENNSFNDFELDILSSEFNKDFNELLSEKNYPCSLSEKDLSGHCPKERDKKYENSEEKKEGDSFDNFNIFNSEIFNKTYSLSNNPYLEDSINVINSLNYSCDNFFPPSSDFSPSENLGSFHLFDSSCKNEGTDDLNDENISFEKHLFNEGKRKREKIFSVSKIPKANKKLNNNNNNNNSCIIGNINQEFPILPNKNNNKSMINYMNKNNKKKSNKKTPKNIFFTKITINEKNMVDNSQEKKTITANNLSDIDKGDDYLFKRKEIK